MAGDGLAAWLRAEITADRDDAARRLRLSRMTAAHRGRLMEKLGRAEAELAVLDLYETQAAREFCNCMEEDRTWLLASVVRLIGRGYRRRPGYRESEWKP